MATHGNRRATLVAAVGFGVAELRADPARAAGWELLVDGVAQSYVDLADPGYLAFEYVRRIGTVLRSVRGAGVPIKVLHVGAGGLTLARFVAATRPGSSQRAVERDGELVALVARLLPAPADVAVVVGDARAICRSTGWPPRPPGTPSRAGCCTAWSSTISSAAQRRAWTGRPERSPVG
jgi:hypothetical protein